MRSAGMIFIFFILAALLGLAFHVRMADSGELRLDADGNVLIDGDGDASLADGAGECPDCDCPEDDGEEETCETVCKAGFSSGLCDTGVPAMTADPQGHTLTISGFAGCDACIRASGIFDVWMTSSGFAIDGTYDITYEIPVDVEPVGAKIDVYSDPTCTTLSAAGGGGRATISSTNNHQIAVSFLDLTNFYGQTVIDTGAFGGVYAPFVSCCKNAAGPASLVPPNFYPGEIAPNNGCKASTVNVSYSPWRTGNPNCV